jgi:hypothetical protein
MNLVGAVFLMLISVADTSGESTAALPRLWQVWEQVDTVLGFTMAAALFIASIGLFLRAPWSRRLRLAVCAYDKRPYPLPLRDRLTLALSPRHRAEILSP